MKKIAVMMTALTLAALMGCDTGTNGGTEPSERVAVSFSTEINPARARAVGTTWDRGDAIGAFMLESGGTGIADNASNRQYVSASGNGSFTPASEGDTIYYPADQRRVDFIAYYPYASGLQGFAYPVDVSDQTNQAKIDLMTAERVSGGGPSAGSVALRFRHRLSRVELEIKAGTSLTDAALAGLKASITGQRTTGSFDINANTLTPSGAGGASISLRMMGNGKSGEGILLPSEAQEGRQLVFTLGGKEFRYTIPAGNEFKAGIRNKYTITLKGSGSDVSPDISVENVITAIIEDWGEGITEEGVADDNGGSTGGGGSSTGGGSAGGGTTGNTEINTHRYYTVPAPGGAQFVSSYTDTKTKQKYVTAYLGWIETAPILWGKAEEYDGPGYGIQTFTVTEEQATSVTETTSATTTASNAIGTTAGIEEGVAESSSYGLEYELKVKLGPFSGGVKEKTEESVTNHFNSSSSNTNLDIDEISKTFETAKETMRSSSRIASLTVGQNRDDKKGFYRYTLFATTKVYVTLMFNPEGKFIEKHTTFVIVPDTDTEKFDYAERRDGFFKTENTPLLKLSKENLDKLYAADTTELDSDTGSAAVSIPPSITANMVKIKGGTFKMGSSPDSTNLFGVWFPELELHKFESPQHKVTVSDFWMGKYEVTQAEYQAVMGKNPSSFKGANLPVEGVRWYDAIVFCNKLSIREGLTPAYRINGSTDPDTWGPVPSNTWRGVTWNRGANGYRLPTEAEWEYACRAGTDTVYYTGDVMDNGTGWYYKNSGKTTHPGGEKQKNSFGLYDMAGNVWEWCWDWYWHYPVVDQTDPEGSPDAFGSRVIRGGSWSTYEDCLRSAFRFYNDPMFAYTISSTNWGDFLGFRLVRSGS